MRSDDEYIKILLEVKNKLGRVPTSKEFEKLGKVAVPRKRFLYNELLKLAGLETQREYFNKEVFEEKVKDYLKINSKIPGSANWAKLFGVDPKTIKKHYGSINNFKSLFVKINPFLNFGEKEMIRFLQNKIDNGELLTSSDLAKNKDLPRLDKIKDILKVGSWDDILIKIDRVDIKKSFTKEKMKVAYIELSKKLNKEYGATIEDINSNLKYSSKSFYLIFQGMDGLRKECGFENPYSRNQTDLIKLKKEIYKIYKELGEVSKKSFIEKLKEKELQSIATVFKAFAVTNLKELYKKLNQE